MFKFKLGPQLLADQFNVHIKLVPIAAYRYFNLLMLYDFSQSFHFEQPMRYIFPLILFTALAAIHDLMFSLFLAKTVCHFFQAFILLEDLGTKVKSTSSRKRSHKDDGEREKEPKKAKVTKEEKEPVPETKPSHAPPTGPNNTVSPGQIQAQQVRIFYYHIPYCTRYIIQGCVAPWSGYYQYKIATVTFGTGSLVVVH